jgi:hypothetical protein
MTQRRPPSVVRAADMPSVEASDTTAPGPRSGTKLGCPTARGMGSTEVTAKVSRRSASTVNDHEPSSARPTTASRRPGRTVAVHDAPMGSGTSGVKITSRAS